jgi:hypothetical protein
MANRGERDRPLAAGNNNQVSHVLHQDMGYHQTCPYIVISTEAKRSPKNHSSFRLKRSLAERSA